MARRAGGPGGRFDHRYEANSISAGIIDELQEPFGSVVEWYVYDTMLTTVDAIYDVGQSDTDGGRAWIGPFYVPVVSCNLNQGSVKQVEHEGYYNVDSLHIVASIDAVKKAGITNIGTDPSSHLGDRIVWKGEVWKANDMQPRGIVGPYRNVVLGIECDQVSDDEMINDVTFQRYAATGTPTRHFGAQDFGDGLFS